MGMGGGVCCVVCAVGVRHVKGRAQCKLLLSLRVLLRIDCAYGVYSLAGLTGYSAYTLLPSLAPYLVQISFRTVSLIVDGTLCWRPACQCVASGCSSAVPRSC